MSLLSRLFRPGETGEVAEFESCLKALEQEAERARPGYQGTPFNQAGDLALRAGHRARALEYYGRAINAFLEDQ